MGVSENGVYLQVAINYEVDSTYTIFSDKPIYSKPNNVPGKGTANSRRLLRQRPKIFQR